MTILDQMLPKKYGDKLSFRTDEVMEILRIRDSETLYALDHKLKPLWTTERIRVYLRRHLEEYLETLNSGKNGK